MSFGQFAADLIECLALATLFIAVAGWVAWWLARKMWDID